jgi:DNA-binding MarR family transcriptional regulator
MRIVRKQMRSRRGEGLSVPQFRALWVIDHNRSACLSDVAEHIGSSLPSTSRMVAALVDSALVRRKTDSCDRRQCCLELTPRGEAVLKIAWGHTHLVFAQRLAGLSGAQRSIVVQAMDLLRSVFVKDV